MRQFTSMPMLAGAFSLAAALSLAGPTVGYTQASDVDAVKTKIASFHSALNSLDLSKMEPLWTHDANVTLINPRDKVISVGWDAVAKNWRNVFNSWSELKVTQSQGPFVRVNGDVAWSAAVANVVGKTRNGDAVNAPTFENDVFEKRGGEWLIVSHSASRVPR